MKSASFLPYFTIFLLLSTTPALSQPLSTADRAWIEACTAALKNERGNTESKRLYCTCMHEQFDDNQPVTQTEMERMYPPLHRACREESGRGR